MLKSKLFLIRIFLVFLAFLTISLIAFSQIKQDINQEFLQSSGHGVQDIAALISSNININDSDVERLKKLSYEQLTEDPVNKGLQKAVSSVPYSTPIQYIYLMTQLSDAEVRYKVDKIDAEFFHVPPETPLKLMWLLDVYVTDVTSIPESASRADIYRYSVLTPTVQKILQEKSPAFSKISDEWGTVLAGYAPVYTQEGNFVGMLGVDMSLEKYQQHSSMAFLLMLLLLLITNGALALLMFFFYFSYLRVKEKEMYQDPLTKAYNRRFFDDYFLQKIKSGSKEKTEVLLMMVDVDHFKSINDTYGHSQGDVCLQMVSDALLSSILPERPCLLIRYGGEEFLAGIALSQQANPAELLEKILNNIRALKPFSDDRQVTVSIGAQLFPMKTVNRGTIHLYIKKADTNLYQAKNSGRDRFVLTND